MKEVMGEKNTPLLTSFTGLAIYRPLSKVVHFSEVAKLASKNVVSEKLEKRLFVKLNIGKHSS